MDYYPHYTRGMRMVLMALRNNSASPGDALQPTASPRDALQPTSSPGDALQPTASPRDALQPTSPGDALQPTGSPGDALQPKASPGDALQPTASSGDALQPTASSGDALQPKASPGDALQPTASPVDALQPKASPGDALQPTASSGDALQPTGSPGDALQPKASPGDALQPTASSGDALQPTASPEDALQPTGSPGDALQPTASPGDALQPTGSPGDALQPKASPGDALQPTASSGDALQPTASSGDALQPKASPGDALQPTASPVDALQPKASPGDALQPTASSGDALQPTGSPGDALQSKASPGDALQPTASSGDALQPTASPEDALQPTGSPGDALQPTASPGDALQPTGSPGDALQPTGSPGDALQPTGSPGDALQPTGSHGYALQPTGSHGDALQPTGSPGDALQPTGSPGDVLQLTASPGDEQDEDYCLESDFDSESTLSSCDFPMLSPPAKRKKTCQEIPNNSDVLQPGDELSPASILPLTSDVLQPGDELSPASILPLTSDVLQPGDELSPASILPLTSDGLPPATKSKKPKRPCLFCGEFQSVLIRHLKRKHANEARVAAANKLPACDQKIAFETLRKEGIFQKNLENRHGDQNADLIRERNQGSAKVVMCGGCKGFFSHKVIKKHKQRYCSREANIQAETIDFTKIPSTSVPENFQREILNHFRDDNVAKVCCNDTLILVMGQKLWTKSVRKKRHSIMSEMRLMGNVILEMRSITECETLCGADVLNRVHFDTLTTAIENLTKKEHGSGQKAGIKRLYGYMLKRAIKVMSGFFIQRNEMEKATEIDRFRSVLDLNWDFIFYSAQLECEQRRNVLRTPQDMPLEDDIKKMRNHIVTKMSTMLEDDYKMWDKYDFVLMRNLIVGRLTLFNARRGGEPARLTLSEWQEAERDHWVDPEMIETVTDPLEQALVNKYKLAYQAGKGSRKLVPVLIPNDTIAPLKKLVCERGNANILENNIYLFPSTGASREHVSGYNCVKSIAASLEGQLVKPNLLIADKFRHRASTIFALQDLPEAQRETWYRHMGHSAEVNKNVYQCPLVLTEMTTVGGFLDKLDQHGKTFPRQAPSSTALSGNSLANTQHGCATITSDQRSQDTTGMGSDCQSSQNMTAITSDERTSDMTTMQFHSVDGTPDIPEEAGRSAAAPSISAKETAQKRRYMQWIPADSEAVCSYFDKYIKAKGKGSTGSLPGFKDIATFLEGRNIFVDSELSDKKKKELVKSKVFNERKTYRKKAEDSIETV